MLSQDENDLLTRIGPGTPCGHFLRRYWQPVALAEELPPGSRPRPVRLLGEDLVLFRDEFNRVGLLELHCSHRGADLSYGRIENGGLRCLYHGWVYDIRGRCLEQPGEPEASTFHKTIRHPWYPCIEMGGIVLAYLGPGDPPPTPEFEFLKASDDYRFNSKIYQECNYQQANEGNIDPIHVPFLHRTYGGRLNAPPPPPASQRWFIDMEVEEAPFGVRVIRAETAGSSTTYIRTTNFILPNLCAFPSGTDDGYTVNWHVPIDDTHHWKYVIMFTQEKPMEKKKVQSERSDLTPDYRLVRNRANRYLQEPDEMNLRTFIGMGSAFQVHDAWATEGEGPIQDRTKEHLGSTDRAIVVARNLMLRIIRQMAESRVVPYPDRFRIPVWRARIPASEDWRKYSKEKNRTENGGQSQ